jgi:hypothetical protein
MAEAQCSVAGNRPLAVQNLGDPIGRYAQLPRKLARRNLDLCKFFGKNLARMNGGSGHDIS